MDGTGGEVDGAVLAGTVSVGATVGSVVDVIGGAVTAALVGAAWSLASMSVVPVSA